MFCKLLQCQISERVVIICDGASQQPEMVNLLSGLTVDSEKLHSRSHLIISLVLETLSFSAPHYQVIHLIIRDDTFHREVIRKLHHLNGSMRWDSHWWKDSTGRERGQNLVLHLCWAPGCSTGNTHAHAHTHRWKSIHVQNLVVHFQ